MCSLNDCACDFGDGITQNIDAIQISNTELCKKCKNSNTPILLRKKDRYCKNCFLINTTHKFRATLGKSKLIYKGDIVLVAYSGNPNSTALLHLIKSGVNAAVHKRIIFSIIVLYIDDGTVKRLTVDERQKIIDMIAEQVKSFKFEGYVTDLYESLNEDEVISIQSMNSYCVITDRNEDLHKIFNSLADETAVMELLRQLRHRLLILAARQLKCNKIFVADSSMDIAMNILSDISLGRGAQLSPDIDFCDTRYQDVLLLRPMRDFTKEEITYYLSCHNLNAIEFHKYCKKDSVASIQALTKNFISQLNLEHGGTVSTVFSTGDKLSTKLLTCSSSEKKCLLCKIPVDTETISDEVCAVEATAFSILLSRNSETLNNINNKYAQMSEKKTSDNTEHCNFLTHLCYACQLIFRNSDIKTTVPTFLLNSVKPKLFSANVQDTKVTL